MQGRHYSKKSKSKLPAILSITAAVVVIAVICGIIFFGGSGKKDNNATTQPATTTEQTSSVSTAETTALPAEESTTEPTYVDVTEASKPEQNVVVPTKTGETAKYFNATYAPNRAVDTYTDSDCSLKEVFGTSYVGGVITFNSDGSFSESVTSSSVNSGAYAVEGDNIVATYTNDKNMSVRVLSWNGDTPSEIVINYGGYDVYFS